MNRFRGHCIQVWVFFWFFLFASKYSQLHVFKNSCCITTNLQINSANIMHSSWDWYINQDGTFTQPMLLEQNNSISLQLLSRPSRENHIKSFFNVQLLVPHVILIVDTLLTALQDKTNILVGLYNHLTFKL